MTGVRFYKATREHRHAHRQPVDGERGRCSPRHVQRRDGDGMAAADVRHARRHHRGNDLRRVVLRAARALLGVVGVLLHRRARSAGTRSTARRCTRSARTAAAPTASTPTRRHDVPDVDLRRRELRRSTSSSRPSSRRAPGARVTAPRPRLGDRQLRRATTGGLPTRYIVTPFIGTTAQTAVDRHRQPADHHGHVSGLTRPLLHVQGPGGATAAARARSRRRRMRSRHRPDRSGRADGCSSPAPPIGR